MRRIIPLAVLVGLLAAAASQAEFVVFTDRSQFEESVYHKKTIDFEGIAVPVFQSGFPFDTGLTRQEVNFVGSYVGTDGVTKHYLWVADDAASPSLYDWGSDAVLYGPSSLRQGSDPKITVTLPAGVTALGADLMTMRPFGSNIVVTLASGEVFHVQTQDYPNLTFWGITSTEAIQSLTFSAQGGSNPMLDNFTFGVATPAPPAVVLFALGSAALLAYQRRRRTPPTSTLPSSAD